MPVCRYPVLPGAAQSGSAYTGRMAYELWSLSTGNAVAEFSAEVEALRFIAELSGSMAELTARTSYWVGKTTTENRSL